MLITGRLKFNLHFRSALLMFVILAFVFFTHVWAEKQVSKANELRYTSLIIADDLYKSLENETKFSRLYVITLNSRYMDYVTEIEEIREGKHPHPDCLIYWNHVLSDGIRPCASTHSYSIYDKMAELNFTDVEKMLVKEAISAERYLDNVKLKAFNLVEKDKSNQMTAINLLHDDSYRILKSKSMDHVNNFLASVSDRTNLRVAQAENLSDILRYIFLVLVGFDLILLGSTYRGSARILGAPVEELYRCISKLGDSSVEPVSKYTQDSLMQKLCEAHQKILDLDEERERNQKKIFRLTNLYKGFSLCNQAIVRCTYESELFNLICKDAVDQGGMTMTWIGKLGGTNLIPIASYGEGSDYVNDLHISINPSNPNSKGPTGIALLTDQPFWCQDFETNPITVPWQIRAAEYGWRSSCALPLHEDDKVIGVFTMYSTELNAFDEDVQNLLIEMSIDIDHALRNFRRKAQLADAYRLLQIVINTIPMRIFWKDLNLKYMGCNEAFAKDAGFETPNDVVGKFDTDLCWAAFAEAYNADDIKTIEGGEPKMFYEERLGTSEGNTITIQTSKAVLKSDKGNTIGVLGVYEDISEKKANEAHIYKLANFDPLTGLPNRSRLDEYLVHALSSAKRSDGNLALMFLDLDHFKDVNDSLGHPIGDKLLIELANRFLQLLRDEDTVTRLGGDEFIFLLPGTDMNGSASVARKLLAAIAEPFKVEGYDLVVTASIGIAFYPQDGTDIETLSKNADAAMYRAKQGGRNTFCFFTQEMQARAVRNMQLVNAMRYGIGHEEFEILYQPQVSIDTGKIVGVEALLRWKHHVYGQINPSEFIPIAEESGYIVTLGEWVLRSAIKQAAFWLHKGTPLLVAVNLSATQFKNTDLPQILLKMLSDAELPSRYLEVELTESASMCNPTLTVETMNLLHSHGIRMSIDDFGTGYSSLAYIKKFQVYKLKVDQSFVRDIWEDFEDRAIVVAIIGIAKGLGLKVIAEGVETRDQLKFLCEHGCDEVQGYLFSKPIKPEAVTALLDTKPFEIRMICDGQCARRTKEMNDGQ